MRKWSCTGSALERMKPKIVPAMSWLWRPSYFCQCIRPLGPSVFSATRYPFRDLHLPGCHRLAGKQPLIIVSIRVQCNLHWTLSFGFFFFNSLSLPTLLLAMGRWHTLTRESSIRDAVSFPYFALLSQILLLILVSQLCFFLTSARRSNQARSGMDRFCTLVFVPLDPSAMIFEIAVLPNVRLTATSAPIPLRSSVIVHDPT